MGGNQNRQGTYNCSAVKSLTPFQSKLTDTTCLLYPTELTSIPYLSCKHTHLPGSPYGDGRHVKKLSLLDSLHVSGNAHSFADLQSCLGWTGPALLYEEAVG